MRHGALRLSRATLLAAAKKENIGDFFVSLKHEINRNQSATHTSLSESLAPAPSPELIELKRAIRPPADAMKDAWSSLLERISRRSEEIQYGTAPGSG